MSGHEGQDGDAREPASDLKAILQLAGDMLVQRKSSEAIEILEGAAEANSTSLPLHHMLTRAYLDSKRIPDAKRELNRLRELGVKDPNPSIWLAATALGIRRFDDAIFYFREAQTLGAEPGEWSILYGNALYRSGRLSEAEEVYQDVLSISNEHRYDLFFGLSSIRMQQKRYQEAADLAMHAHNCPVKYFEN